MIISIPDENDPLYGATRCPRVPAFIADYARLLWECGSTCARLQKNVTRLSTALGLHADMTVLPQQILIVFSSEKEETSLTVVRKIRKMAIDFSLNTRLSTLSWEVADGKLDFEQAEHKMEEIIRSPVTPPLKMLIYVSLANAAFCRLFGGDISAVLTVLVATMIGFFFKQTLLRQHRDVRLVVTFCSFISACICAAPGIMGWGNTPGIALGASVLYLVPGVPYINSISDLISRHYLCSLYRLTDAFVLTACLSLGLCLGIKILHLGWI